MNVKDKLKNINCGLIAAIIVIAICSCTLFFKPIIGMADNGDFFRIISQNNLYYMPQNYDGMFLDYFYKDFGICKYFDERPKVLISTQSIFIKIAVFIDKLITKDYTFDLRFLAFIYMIIYAIAAYFIVKVLTKDIRSIRYKLLITAIYIIIFCDTGYVAYFNSFYGEAVCLTLFLLSIGVLLYILKYKKYNNVTISIFFILSVIFIGSKQQIAPVGILVAILLVRLSILKNEKKFRYICIALAITSVFSSAYFYQSIKGDFDYINRYYAMTRGILLYEWKSDDILREFNINPQYSLLQDTVYFNKLPNINPTSEKLRKEFYDKYSFIKVLTFYLGHPKSFFKMINFSVVNGYTIKNKVIGNYEKIEGRTPAEQTKFFTLWSTFKDKYMPHNFFFTIVLMSIYFGFSVKRYVNASKKGHKERMLIEEVFAYIFLVGVAQLFVSVIGAGDGDLGKHVFMFNVTFDIMLIYSLALIIKSVFDKKHVC